VLELFKNAAKIKQLFDEQKYVKAAALLAKTLAALLGEFSDGGEGGVPVFKSAKKPKAADVKNLEKAEAVLSEVQSAPKPVGDHETGSAWLPIVIQLLPVVLDLIRRLRERNG
jgi:hypothetical protein